MIPTHMANSSQPAVASDSATESSRSFKVLVTGFGPFKSHSVNASWEAVSRLPDRVPNTRIEIVKEQIEVSYSFVDAAVPQLWKKHSPDLVIHVGVSDQARTITLEACGHKGNYVNEDIYRERPSAAQCKAVELCRLPETDRIRSRLDLDRLVEHFRSNKDRLNETLDIDISRVDFSLSCNAGRYLCEYIYFTSLCIDDARCVFVHVPMIDVPYSLQELTQSLLSIIVIIFQELMS